MALRDRLIARIRRTVAPASFAPAAAPPPPPTLPAPLEVRQDSGEQRRDSFLPPWPFAGAYSEDSGAMGLAALYGAMPLDESLLSALYRFSGVAHRYVSLPAERATRKGWTCSDVEESENKRLDVYNVVAEGILWSRLWGAAVGMLVTDDDLPRSFRKGAGGDPRAWLREPLDLTRVRKLHRVQIFDGVQAKVQDYQRNPLDPGFLEPRLWNISAGSWYGTVHHSRLVWFRGRKRPPSEVETGYALAPDDSVLQVGWRALDLLMRTMDSGSDLAQSFHETLVKISGLAAINTSDQGPALTARLQLMEEYRRRNGFVVLDPEDDYQTRTHSPAGFTSLSEPQMRWLAAELGWPQSLLFGDGPGGLSTDDKGGREQERQLWSDTQEHYRKAIEYLYLVLLSSREGPTGGKVPEDWALVFNPLDEPDQAALAEVRAKVAETDQAYISMGVFTPEFVAEHRIKEDTWQFDLPSPPIPDSQEVLDQKVQEEIARQQMEGGEDPDDEPEPEE